MPQFVMVVEAEQLERSYDWPHQEDPPDVIYNHNGIVYIRVGHYAAPGNRWSYRRPIEAVVIDGALHWRK
jgi:hypothetical protein